MIPAIVELLRSPRATAALTTAGAGLIAIAFTAQQLIGWPGYAAALVVLDLLLVASLLARREEIDWHWAILPISLLAFLTWVGISVFWSEYQRATLLSVGYLLLVTLVGVFIGLSRDTIQIIRSVGDVLRAVLVSSIVVEALSGIIFDAPLKALNIDGELAFGGPISGLVNTRNQLGLLAAIALVTFAIEWRTKSITRIVAIPSVALAVGTMIFTRSPVVAMVAVVLVAAGDAALRHPAFARRAAPVCSILGARAARSRGGACVGVSGADHRAFQRHRRTAVPPRSVAGGADVRAAALARGMGLDGHLEPDRAALHGSHPDGRSPP